MFLVAMYYVIFNDNSKRTLKILKPTLLVSILVVILITSFVFSITQTIKFNTVIAKSSTPTGTSLLFPRSNATVTLKNIYVDKNKNVLIARLSGDSNNSLPYKATDYRVYLASKSLNGYKEANILFGRLSTDGDMFLVIPRPTKDIYSVFIMNKKYLAPIKDDLLSSDSSSSQLDDTQNSISQSISNYQFDEQNPEKSSTYNLESSNQDVISFRLTTDPAYKNDDRFKPEVLNANLLNKDNQFDFEKFFDVAFRKAILKNLEDKYNKVDNQLKLLLQQKNELDSRIGDNPNDTQAKQSLNNLTQKVDSMNRDKENIAKDITNYTLLPYKDSYFEHINKKAIVVQTE